MPRININFPFAFPFQLETSVRMSDVNDGNHRGQAALISMLHEARVQVLTSLSYSEFEIEGCSLIMRDLAVHAKPEPFSRQARTVLGEALCIEVVRAGIGQRRFALVHRVRSSQGRREIARATMCGTFFNSVRRTSVPVPPTLLRKMKLVTTL